MLHKWNYSIAYPQYFLLNHLVLELSAHLLRHRRVSTIAANAIGKLQFFTAGETDKQNNDGAFVFVVRNKQMILTKYKGFIDKNRQHTDEAKPAVAITAPQRTTTIVLQQKHTRQERQPDFSVKKVPVQ